ncbi:hypothetical protein NHX12_014452 [Muraenolepis orangiensis]|uniref:Uncharacterized protein n=1 Tax=Muraenolepis orangiensis TaxID=630683 RepID=A0A9Q0I5M8_9TELE|nr:hypothetical protein NHX12_014452 [Muraenolepis orangiensis]
MILKAPTCLKESSQQLVSDAILLCELGGVLYRRQLGRRYSTLLGALGRVLPVLSPDAGKPSCGPLIEKSVGDDVEIGTCSSGGITEAYWKYGKHKKTQMRVDTDDSQFKGRVHCAASRSDSGAERGNYTWAVGNQTYAGARLKYASREAEETATCTVSNPVSWGSASVQLECSNGTYPTDGSIGQDKAFTQLWVYVLSGLGVVLLTLVLVWLLLRCSRRTKAAQHGNPEQFLTRRYPGPLGAVQAEAHPGEPEAYIKELQDMWCQETGDQWDHSPSTIALFLMTLKRGLPEEVQTALNGFVGLKSKRWFEIQSYIVHHVEAQHTSYHCSPVSLPGGSKPTVHPTAHGHYTSTLQRHFPQLQYGTWTTTISSPKRKRLWWAKR